MSKILSNLFGSNKSKNINQKFDDQIKKKESNQNKNTEEDLPPIVIPRRLSLSKSGRMKERKRTKLSVLNIVRTEGVVDDTNQKTEPKSQSASRESLDKAE